MKKILILTNKESTILNFRSELINRLISLGYDLYIALPNTGEIDKIRRLGFKSVIEIELNRHGTNIFEEFKLIKTYKKIIKEVKPDLVLTYTIKPNIYGGIASRKNKVPCIANITGLGTSINQEGLKSKLMLYLYKLGIKKNKCIFVQNTSILKTFQKKGLKKLILIPGSGVNVNKFTLKEYNQITPIKFLYVGRIMKDKGVYELKEAYQKLFLENKNIELNIVGDVEIGCENIFLDCENINIKYHGLQSNVIPYYEKSTCVILPSYHEGMSNVLLEAAAIGRCLITTNISGCKEIVFDGYNGYLCEPKNVDSLYEAMKKITLLDVDTIKLFGKNANKHVVDNFNREKVIDTYETEILKILER